MTQLAIAAEIPVWTLTDRLRKAREHAGMTQTELAESTGIGRSTIVTYETGKSSPPRHVLLAWASITGVSIDWLEGDDGQASKRRKSAKRPVPITGQYSRSVERPTDSRPRNHPLNGRGPGRRPRRLVPRTDDPAPPSNAHPTEFDIPAPRGVNDHG